MGRQKKSSEQLNAEATAESLLQDQRECNRLLEQAERPRVKARLEQMANNFGHMARRWQDYATELEYAHLYEEMEIK